MDENPTNENRENGIIRSIDETSDKDSFIQFSFQNCDVKEKIAKSPINKSNKNIFEINFQNDLSKSFENDKKQNFSRTKTKNSSNLKNKKSQLGGGINEIKKLSKEKSNFFLSDNNNFDVLNSNNRLGYEINNSIFNNQNINSNLNLSRKKSEGKISKNINNIKYDIKAKNDISNKELKIPTLNEINNTIENILISNHIQTKKKENNNFGKNDAFQKISKPPKNKFVKKLKKYPKQKSFLTRKENDISNEFSKTKSSLNETYNYDLKNDIKDKEFQKKYRKLLMRKNLYDSLDDEEMLDAVEENYLYISINSFTAYLLDFIILISSLIELYYFPIFVSSYISPFNNMHYNMINTIIFYFIDFACILDLITGFFQIIL